MQLIRGKQMQNAYKICLYAPEGIGKTTFASHMPNPVFIDTEGGSGFLDVARTERPTSWMMLMSQVKYFVDHPQELGTLVIDTLDWAEKLCIEQICATKQIKGIEDIPYGKGYVYVAEEFGRMLNLLEDLRLKGVHIFLTAHAMLRKFEQPDEMGSYDKWELKLSKKVAPMVKEFVDALFFANYETIVVKNEEKKNKARGGQRIMYTTHHCCWDAKNRFGLPDKLPLDFGQIAGLFQPGTAAPAAPVQKIQQPQHQVQQATDPGTQAPAPTLREDPYPLIEEPDPELPFNGPTDEAPAGIPKALWDLMQSSGVTEAEIVDAVARKGYFPAGMKIANYPEDFVRGVLIGAWDQVHLMIQNNRKEQK
jgi:hypothetical protein